MPRVFSRDNIGRLQHLNSTQRDIAQIANRCSDDEKHSVSSIQNHSLAIEPSECFAFQQSRCADGKRIRNGGKMRKSSYLTILSILAFVGCAGEPTAVTTTTTTQEVTTTGPARSEEHTSELQSLTNIVCR